MPVGLDVTLEYLFTNITNYHIDPLSLFGKLSVHFLKIQFSLNTCMYVFSFYIIYIKLQSLKETIS